MALPPALTPAVGRLPCFRGISLHSSMVLAMVLATEIGDWRRFARPTQLACYLGLVSREHASRERHRLGSIAEAGNSHCRHMLVESAWSHRHRPQTSVDLERRQQSQAPAIITHAWTAQQRLHQRFTHLAYRKRPRIAVVAVARKLVGFLGAVMQDAPVALGWRDPSSRGAACGVEARRASTLAGVMRPAQVRVVAGSPSLE